MANNEIKKYYDHNGEEYEEGDIVLNPFFGDYWLVEKYTEEEMKINETDCPLCFSQYGDKNSYYMDIDEPTGFVIVCRKGEPHYNLYLKKFKEIISKMNEEEK